MKKVRVDVALIAAASWLTCCAASAQGPAPAPGYGPPNVAPPGALVVEVRVVGNETVREEKVRSFLHTRRDREFDSEVVQADVRRLVSSGLFHDVRVLPQLTAQGWLVTFEVFERPTIREIAYVGNRQTNDKTLARQTGLKVGDALNYYAVEEGRRKIEEFYRTKGFPEAEVAVLEGDKPQDRRVVYWIGEGVLQRILWVEFVGNQLASDGRLATQIQSKPMLKVIPTKVNRQKIDEDVERLTAYYRALGYFRARVSRELRFDDSGKWGTLTFVIDEGPRYVVRNVSIMGNEKLPADALTDKLRLHSGDYFNLNKMNADVNGLLDEYGSRGYVYADVNADPRFLLDGAELDLVYNVQEGEVFRVGKINVHIAGETPHTRRNVVLNRISLRPGDIIDIREVRMSERRLKASNLFETNPTLGEPPKIVISPPELSGVEQISRRSGGSSSGGYRGQSPDGAPVSIPSRDLNVFTPPIKEDYQPFWRP